MVQEGSEYPVREQIREVWYDLLKLRAKVKSLNGEDEGKVWLRRYDQVDVTLLLFPGHLFCLFIL